VLDDPAERTWLWRGALAEGALNGQSGTSTVASGPFGWVWHGDASRDDSAVQALGPRYGGQGFRDAKKSWTQVRKPLVESD